MTEFDGTMPLVTPAEILETLNDPDDVGWFAYILVGPDDSGSDAYQIALAAKELLAKLKIYRAETSAAVGAWLNASPNAGGVILGRNGTTQTVVTAQQAADYTELLQALNQVNLETA